MPKWLHTRLLRNTTEEINNLPDKILTPTRDKNLSIIRYKVSDSIIFALWSEKSNKAVGAFALEMPYAKDHNLRAIVKTPHIALEKNIQDKGWGSFFYNEALDSGICLMSDVAQSFKANMLWRSLARHRTWFIIDIEGQSPIYLRHGNSLSPEALQGRDIRIIMLGKNWTLSSWAMKANMEIA